MSEKTTGEVRFEIDPNNLPRISEDRMAALKSMADDAIDYSDTPSQAGKPWRRANRFEGLVALEPDVLEFFKENGDASAGKINSVLRDYVRTQRKSA